MLTLLLLSLPIFLIFFYLQKHKTNHHHNPPGPHGLPFIGNLHQFDGRNPHTYLYNLSKKYGPLMFMKLGFRKVMVVSSSNTVQEIMKSHDLGFSGRPVLVSLQKLSYNGMDVAFSSYSDTWKEMKRVSNLHLFSVKQARSFRPVFREEVSRMIRKIAADASLSRVTDLSEYMRSFTSNAVCRVAFGRSCGDELTGLLRETQSLLAGFFVEDYFPLLGWIDKFFGMGKRLEKNFREFDSLYEELIQEHLDYSNRPKSMEGDILDLLLGIRKDGSSSVDITFDHIKALLMNILTAGTDTTSALLVWAMTALIKNPLIMKKVQTEVRQLATIDNKDLLDEDDISNLPYLRAVIKETFRLYPPAPLLSPRETIQKCRINGYEIEPGTLVYLNAWAIGRDPQTWENPNEFLPERFLKCDIDLKGKDPELIPFGIGRRRCPGISIGVAKIEIALANLLRSFDWELPVGMKEEDIDFDVLPGMTMHKKNALCVVAKLHMY
ncbi:hypothetical protein ABFS82_04G164800 [Erythranthe guttata]|uniref:Cytochrome P450 n=1 Tax=Erythranthe guttata TaxID=4155 RepID=A0A022QLE0_ERYGU|nr:PREDICTED: cytochrome P450 83B1-like [Erythranthe guttata]EYU29507.1 hypothetical protein MIMGU_mgv1a005223mg [Erythranthe guttata]|eukprot:XP_012846820.1 PREDICTED: cytochrome P450 83B1-like [Erythranthe guttata]